MKFLLDESADYPLAGFLRELGHDVTAIAHDYPHALKDPDVLAIAFEERRILITNDNDFGELVFRQQLPHAGIILLRLGKEDLETKIERLGHVLINHSQQLSGFLVVSDTAVRIRDLRSH